MDTFYVFSRTLVFLAIGCLLLGWRFRTEKGHYTAMVGWLLFGIFWLLLIPHYLDEGEPVNAIYCVLGFPLFLFLMYHEYLSVKWGDDPASLPFMAGTVGMSAGMYFLIDTFPEVAAFFIWTTALETAGFLSLFGYQAQAGSVIYEDVVRVPIFHGDQRGVSIILACTAIQSIVIFIAAILTTRIEKDPAWRVISFKRFGTSKNGEPYTLTLSRKWKAFVFTVPIILLMNIVRTASVIYLVYEGHVDFDLAHNGLSRWGSMLVLIVLAYWMFDILPELHDNIIGIPMLVKRKKPGENEEGANPEKNEERGNNGKNGERGNLGENEERGNPGENEERGNPGENEERGNPGENEERGKTEKNEEGVNPSNREIEKDTSG